MFGRRRKRAATVAEQFARALGEMSDQFEGRVQVSDDRQTLVLFAMIPSNVLAGVITKVQQPTEGEGS